MDIYSDRENIEASCRVCGYRKWTEEDLPSDKEIELAKKLLVEMNAEQIEQALVECEKEGIPLVEKFRKEVSNE